MKFHSVNALGHHQLSPPARGAWIEIRLIRPPIGSGGSPPARGAWIEITSGTNFSRWMRVAPREGGVD